MPTSSMGQLLFKEESVQNEDILACFADRKQMQHTKPCKLLYKPQGSSCMHYFYGLIFIKISANVYIRDCYKRCISVQATSSGVQQKWNATTMGCLPCAIRHCIPGPTVSTPTLALQQPAHAAEALNAHTCHQYPPMIALLHGQSGAQCS